MQRPQDQGLFMTVKPELKNNTGESSNFTLRHFLVVVSTFLLVSISMKLIGQFVGGWHKIFFGPLSFILLLGYHNYREMPTYLCAVFIGFVLAANVISVYCVVNIIQSNFIKPHVWDFLPFYLNGQVAAKGLNFYHHENYQQIYQLLVTPFISTNYGFLQEVLNVGFTYPPPTMFYFFPLGWFDYNKAHLIWCFVNSLIMLVDIFLIWDLFLNENKILGLALSLPLLLLLPATIETIHFEQTNFIVLLTLLLLWRDREHARAGIWVAIGIFTKPIMAVFLVDILIRRKWRAMYVAIITLSILSLLAIMVFGSPTFFAYFTENPSSKLPIFVYNESVNQSLLATILRLTNYPFDGMSPLSHPIFISLGALVAGITWWLVYRLDTLQSDWALALTMSLGLLIYPGTLSHYSTLLIVPILFLYACRQQIVGGTWLVVFFIAVINSAMSRHAFISNALIWLALASICFWKLKALSFHHKPT